MQFSDRHSLKWSRETEFNEYVYPMHDRRTEGALSGSSAGRPRLEQRRV
jgi:hypothetical protein